MCMARGVPCRRKGPISQRFGVELLRTVLAHAHVLVAWWHGKKIQLSRTLTRDFFPVVTPMVLFRGLGKRQLNKCRPMDRDTRCVIGTLCQRHVGSR